MENIKQRLSDVAHNWSYIGMITLFLFTVQPGPTVTQALQVETPKSTVQLKKETLEKYSTTVYKPSEMLTDGELKELLSAVGFEGKALKQAWAIAKSESNSRPWLTMVTGKLETVPTEFFRLICWVNSALIVKKNLI